MRQNWRSVDISGALSAPVCASPPVECLPLLRGGRGEDSPSDRPPHVLPRPLGLTTFLRPRRTGPPRGRGRLTARPAAPARPAAKYKLLPHYPSHSVLFPKVSPYPLIIHSIPLSLWIFHSMKGSTSTSRNHALHYFSTETCADLLCEICEKIHTSPCRCQPRWCRRPPWEHVYVINN